MGAAQFTELSAGLYAVSVSSLSYSDKVLSDVELQGDETKSVEITLFSRVIQLDQVSVTTSRRQEKVLDAPASISVLDDSQIRARGRDNARGTHEGRCRRSISFPQECHKGVSPLGGSATFFPARCCRLLTIG